MSSTACCDIASSRRERRGRNRDTAEALLDRGSRGERQRAQSRRSLAATPPSCVICGACVPAVDGPMGWRPPCPSLRMLDIRRAELRGGDAADSAPSSAASRADRNALDAGLHMTWRRLRGCGNCAVRLAAHQAPRSTIGSDGRRARSAY